MALRTTLGELVEMVKDEATLSSASSRGKDHTDAIKRKIRRVYAMLVDGYDWQHLRLKPDDADKTLSAGARYYDFPVLVNKDRPFTMFTQIGSVWQPMEYGITPVEYSAIDSDADERADPPVRWRWHDDLQFEVWPIPASNGGLVRLDGQRQAEALTAESNRADIDDHIISLLVAAELMEKASQKEAASLRAAANRRIAQQTYTRGDQTRFTLGRGMKRPRVEVPRITVAYVRNP